MKFTLLYKGNPKWLGKKDDYYWNRARLDLNAKIHYSIYHAENLDGLYLKEQVYELFAGGRGGCAGSGDLFGFYPVYE